MMKISSNNKFQSFLKSSEANIFSTKEVKYGHKRALKTISRSIPCPLDEITEPKILYQLSLEDLINMVKWILEQYIPPFSIKRQKEEDKLITATEAKNILSISSSTLWRMDKAGLIKSVGFGKHKRFKYQSIIEYLQGNG